MDFKFHLASVRLPPDWVELSPDDDGYCYLRLYSEDRWQKVARILGAYPTWGSVKALGNFNARGPFHTYVDSEGVYHISGDGIGVCSGHLQLPSYAIVGGNRHTGPSPNLGALCTAVTRCGTHAELCYQANTCFNKCVLYITIVLVVLGGLVVPVSSSNDIELYWSRIQSSLYGSQLEVQALKPVFRKYLDVVEFGLPVSSVCVYDVDKRNEILNADVPRETLESLIFAMCPHTQDLVGIVEIGMDSVVTPVTESGSKLERTIDSVVELTTDIPLDVVNKLVSIVPLGANIAGHITESTVRFFEEAADGLVCVSDASAQVVGEVPKWLVDQTKSLISELPETKPIVAGAVERATDIGEGVIAFYDAAVDSLPHMSEMGSHFSKDIVSLWKDGYILVKWGYRYVWDVGVELEKSSLPKPKDISDLVNRFQTETKTLITDVYGTGKDLIKSTHSYVKAGGPANTFISVLEGLPWLLRVGGKTVGSLPAGFIDTVEPELSRFKPDPKTIKDYFHVIFGDGRQSSWSEWLNYFTWSGTPGIARTLFEYAVVLGTCAGVVLISNGLG